MVLYPALYASLSSSHFSGFDFYNEWFKLGLEFKMMYGLFDQLKREHNLYTNSIQSLKSKIFQFSITFE